MNKWNVEYPCGCAATGTSYDPLPSYCPTHGQSQLLSGAELDALLAKFLAEGNRTTGYIQSV